MERYLKKIIMLVYFIFAFTPSLYAAIFLNTTPDDIRIKEGDPLIIPVFIVSESLVEKEIELFVYREDMETGAIKYLSAEGIWLDTTQTEGIKPVLSYGPMPAYINLYWSAFQDTTGMRSFIIHLCLDDVLDGILQGSDCGSHNIYVKRLSQCSELVVNPANIADDLQRGDKREYRITVKDNCNNLIDFNGQSSAAWITLNKQKGLLTLSVDSSNLSKGQHEGKVTISAFDGSSRDINVSLNVTAPTIPIGEPCVPKYLSLTDLYISVKSGESTTRLNEIMNNCGESINYTATVIQGEEWLSVQPFNNRVINVIINAQNLNPGSYEGSVIVMSESFSGIFNVFLDVY